MKSPTPDQIRRRHPCIVTADRLANHLYDWSLMSRLTGKDRDALREARRILEELIEETKP